MPVKLGEMVVAAGAGLLAAKAGMVPTVSVNTIRMMLMIFFIKNPPELSFITYRQLRRLFCDKIF